MQTQFPLQQIDQNSDKTAEHWFDHYSVEIKKIGKDKIPLLNKDVVKKHELIRFRGTISNQLNNEYFNDICQFRDLEDVKQSEPDHTANKPKIMQRSPMVIRSEPNASQWCKSALFGKNKQTKVQTVVAKFYCHTKSLKICDSVEIYGIWSPKPQTEIEKENKSDNGKALYTEQTNKYDALPTIHVLYYTPIEWCNPLISESNTLNDLSKLFNFYFENSSLIRASLIKYISKTFVNCDHLLAEYILLNLVSKTVSNNNGILIGYFPLNIRGQFNTYKIKDLYSELLPFTLNIVLGIQYLNSKRFDPVKNNETDELEIGILQFRENTCVIIDETLLNEGSLNKVGLQNLESLKTLISEQKVMYDFVYHKIPFTVDSSIVVLSKTKPLPQIQSHCYIYADDYTCANDEKQSTKSEDFEEPKFTLAQYRIYLSLCGSLMDKFELKSNEVCKEIEDDFVSLRKEDKTANEDTLHHRLLLMRLINASFLNQTNSDDMMNILRYMQMMEMKRKIRNDKFIKVAKQSKGTPLNKIVE